MRIPKDFFNTFRENVQERKILQTHFLDKFLFQFIDSVLVGVTRNVLALHLENVTWAHVRARIAWTSRLARCANTGTGVIA